VIDPLRLQLVLELGRRGSISAAAEACSLGQPTASSHLRKLEAATGRRLYERDGRRTRLTDAGQLVARHAAVVLSALDGLEQDLAALGGALTGTLRLSVCDGFGNYVLPDVLAVFVREHPLAAVEVRVARSGDVLRDVARGDADLGVAGEVRRLSGVVYERLMRDELIAIAPTGPSRWRDVVEPSALENEVLLVSTAESSARALTERALARAESRPARMLELGSVEAIKRAVRADLGVALVPRAAVSDELARGELREFELRGVGAIDRWFDVVRAEHREPTPLEREFERSLRARVGEVAPSL
jgi:DNA-binding transcriptional LysR family regulator